MRKVFQVVEIKTSNPSNPLVDVNVCLTPFWNGTFDSLSKAVQRQTKGVEELTETFIVHTQIGNPKHPDGTQWVGKIIGTGEIISCEEVRFRGFSTDYTKLYGVIRYEVK